MRLDDLPPSSLPRDQMEALTMADRLGGTVLDSSGSTKSSRPDWETVLTNKPIGRSGLGWNKAWRRDLNIRGPGTKHSESKPKKRLSSRAVSGRKGSMDEEVLMVVESQAARLSELDTRNKSIMSENSEIKSVLLRSREDMGAMRSQMEQMAELLKMMSSQGGRRPVSPNSEASNENGDMDSEGHRGTSPEDGDSVAGSHQLTKESRASTLIQGPLARQRNGNNGMILSPQENAPSPEIEGVKEGQRGKGARQWISMHN